MFSALLKILTAFFLLSNFIFYVQAQSTNVSPEIKRIINSDSAAFINNKYNYLQFTDRRQVEKLQELLKQSARRKVSIAHFGDSHVQLDHFPSTVRMLLQNKYGNAGRGMFFPFAICKTYSHTDFVSRFTGRWNSANSIQTPPKIPIGVSGFAAQSKDDRSSIAVNFNKTASDSVSTLSLLMSASGGSFDVFVNSGRDTQYIYVDSLSKKISWNLKFNQPVDSLECVFQKTSADSGFISLYGLIIENEKPGIIYHNLGVGGAIFSAMIHQKYFEQQFPVIHPDIVILDWGTNDIIYKNMISDTLEATIKKTIRKVRVQNPDVLVVLTSVQDMNWKAKNVTSCKGFSDLVRKISVEENCLFYDWFYVAGGRNSMKKWEQKAWGRKDNIHLTREGYILKGELFFQAMEKSIELINSDKSLQNYFLGPVLQ